MNKRGAELLYALKEYAYIMDGRECLEFLKLKDMKIIASYKFDEFKDLQQAEWVQGSDRISDFELDIIEKWGIHYTSRNDPWIITKTYKNYKIWKELVAVDEVSVQRQLKYRKKKHQLKLKREMEAAANG